MTNLNALLEGDTRQTVVTELAELIDKTVSNQSGLTGMALKSAVAAGKKADADAIPKGVNRLLPQITEELAPFWSGYESSDTQGFGSYLVSRENEVVEAMLGAADKATSDMPSAMQKAYSTLRGKAGKIVSPALPELGDIIERHAK
ncbi:hypothetical protein CGLAU_00045 [Corynebacterium glaucum]|uniref:Uncharacterized protein n=1 Tax=Corynebacterium glaucum TaxID=187491 RepID=A0A1Q2HT45_9CORY|nr:hypothetical protein [Corynebacterium glaucum]AQQ14017.1 hypothetical protein CGLAU_00045 [Corynebacterium glaucum]